MRKHFTVRVALVLLKPSVTRAANYVSFVQYFHEPIIPESALPHKENGGLLHPPL